MKKNAERYILYPYQIKNTYGGKGYMLTKDMLLIDAFKTEGVNVEAMADVLGNFGMHCLGCALSHGETIEQAAIAHGYDPDEMLKALNEAAKA